MPQANTRTVWPGQALRDGRFQRGYDDACAGRPYADDATDERYDWGRLFAVGSGYRGPLLRQDGRCNRRALKAFRAMIQRGEMGDAGE